MKFSKVPAIWSLVAAATATVPQPQTEIRYIYHTYLDQKELFFSLTSSSMKTKGSSAFTPKIQFLCWQKFLADWLRWKPNDWKRNVSEMSFCPRFTTDEKKTCNKTRFKILRLELSRRSSFLSWFYFVRVYFLEIWDKEKECFELNFCDDHSRVYFVSMWLLTIFYIVYSLYKTKVNYIHFFLW